MQADSDLRLEDAVLGCMIASSAACYEALCFPVGPEHFTQESNRLTLKAIERCYRQAGEVDVALLHTYLTETGASEAVGWEEILSVTEYVPTSRMISVYLPRLDELRVRRAKRIAIEDAKKAIEKGHDDQTDEALERASQLKARRRPRKSRSHQMHDLHEHLAGKTPPPMLTGFKAIDRRMKGLFRGRSYALAGLTGVGKTTLAWQIAIGVARSGVPVFVWSKEMSTLDCNALALRIVSGVSVEHGQLDNLPDEVRSRVDEAAKELQSLPIDIDDTASNLPAMVRDAKAFRGKYGLIIVDHARIVRVPGADQVRQMAEVSAACKQVFAVECNAACLVLAQFTREAAKAYEEEGSEPGMHQIYGGEALAQDCNAVMIVHRSSYGGKSKAADAVLKIAKMRDGQRAGPIKLGWDNDRGRYTDPEEGK